MLDSFIFLENIQCNAGYWKADTRRISLEKLCAIFIFTRRESQIAVKLAGKCQYQVVPVQFYSWGAGGVVHQEVCDERLFAICMTKATIKNTFLGNAPLLPFRFCTQHQCAWMQKFDFCLSQWKICCLCLWELKPNTVWYRRNFQEISGKKSTLRSYLQHIGWSIPDDSPGNGIQQQASSVMARCCRSESSSSSKKSWQLWLSLQIVVTIRQETGSSTGLHLHDWMSCFANNSWELTTRKQQIMSSLHRKREIDLCTHCAIHSNLWSYKNEWLPNILELYLKHCIHVLKISDKLCVTKIQQQFSTPLIYCLVCHWDAPWVNFKTWQTFSGQKILPIGQFNQLKDGKEKAKQGDLWCTIHSCSQGRGKRYIKYIMILCRYYSSPAMEEELLEMATNDAVANPSWPCELGLINEDHPSYSGDRSNNPRKKKIRDYCSFHSVG